MKIVGCETLHCDAGWRNFSFLKLMTDAGVTGISEFNESYGSKGLSGVVEKLVASVIGEDALAHERVTQRLYAVTRQAPGGMIAQAIAAVENALLDIKGKALGVPVYRLLGGPVRQRLRLYWSHCGTYRVGAPARFLEGPPLTSLDDVRTLGARVREGGFTALKTNIVMFDGEPRLYMPGFALSSGWPELNPDRRTIEGLRRLIGAFREGAGQGVDILLDLNFNFKTEGFLTVARALDELGLMWFEIDSYDAPALAHIRRSLRTPVASCESLFGTRGFRPFLEHHAVDVAIVDVPWNGIWESFKIAAMAEAYEINVAPHNFYGHLSTLMSGHFCAAIPNFRIMEIDIDDVPWKDDLVTDPPRIEDGHLLLPTAPGWGTELNEAAIRTHPPR